MGRPRKDAIEEKDLHGFKHFKLLMPVLEKLHEFLPVGMEAVLITDRSLACVPPKAITT